MSLEDLQKAIFASDLTTIEDILEEDVDDLLSQRDKQTGSSAIHYATFVGRIDIIHYLVHQGAEVDAKNNRGETPLHIACTRRLAEIVDYFMQLDIDKFPLTLNNWTVLHCCAANNSVECAELLQFTAHEINSRDFFGETPLHVACGSSNRYMVDWLLKRQADPEICDNLSRQPMHLACSTGSIDIIHLLIARKAPLNTTDYKERTIFHYACRSPLKQQYTIDMLRYLFECTNVSPWAKDLDHAYPINYALSCRKTKVARFLVAQTAGRSSYAMYRVFCYASAMDPNSSFFNFLRKRVIEEIQLMTDNYGYTSLHYASEYDREDRVTCLISMKIDVNSRANDGTTPLHCAVAAKSRYGAEVLLENKADVNAIRDDGITPLHLACMFPNHDILVDLLASGADIYATDYEGRTPLMFLCNSDIETDETLQMLESLLAHRPKLKYPPNQLELTDERGWTPLHYACARGNPSLVVDLVKFGANVNAVDNCGKNALHLAVHSRQSLKIMNTLTRKTKTIVNVRDRRGFLPVHYAAMKSNPEVVIDLLKLGRAKSHFLPQSGMPYQLTPLHLAVWHGHTDTVIAILNFHQKPNEGDQLDDCLRDFQALRITEDETSSPNASIDQDGHRPYDPFTAEDNLRRIPLHYAMSFGHESMLKLLSPPEKCMNLFGWKDFDGVTPLMMAAVNGNDACVKFALDQLENVPNARSVRLAVDNWKRCAAMLSVTAKGESYKQLVTADIVTKKDRKLRGFIHRAAFAKKNDLLADIINWAPSEIDAEDTKNITALHIACTVGNIKGVELLVEANANLKKLDMNKLSPGDWAAASGHWDVLSLLLNKYKGRLVLSEFAIARTCENGSLKCVQLLVEHFPGMAQCLTGYRAPLHIAVEAGHIAICRYLVDNGALLNGKDSEGVTPLMLAAANPKGEKCVAILTDELDCSLTKQGPDGNSALHLACLHNNLNSAIHIYNALYKRDELTTVLDQKNHKGESLLHLAVKMTSSTMLNQFIPDMKERLVEMDNRGRMPIYAMIEQPEVIKNMNILLAELLELAREDANKSSSTVNRSQIDTSQQADLDESY